MRYHYKLLNFYTSCFQPITVYILLPSLCVVHRIGLLYRTAMLFVSNVLYHTFYLVYLNSEDLLSGYAFSASSIILVSKLLHTLARRCVALPPSPLPSRFRVKFMARP